MTKTNIDTLLQDFHDQLHIPLLDACIKASREERLRTSQQR